MKFILCTKPVFTPRSGENDVNDHFSRKSLKTTINVRLTLIEFKFRGHPSVRSHGTLAMIMVNLAKSWLTMVPLSRS